MGLNLVAACHRHREKMWVLRGHEHAALRYWFFGAHSDCKQTDPDSVVVSHDQADDPWMHPVRASDEYTSLWWDENGVKPESD